MRVAVVVDNETQRSRTTDAKLLRVLWESPVAESRQPPRAPVSGAPRVLTAPSLHGSSATSQRVRGDAPPLPHGAWLTVPKVAPAFTFQSPPLHPLQGTRQTLTVVLPHVFSGASPAANSWAAQKPHPDNPNKQPGRIFLSLILPLGKL